MSKIISSRFNTFPSQNFLRIQLFVVAVVIYCHHNCDASPTQSPIKDNEHHPLVHHISPSSDGDEIAPTVQLDGFIADGEEPVPTESLISVVFEAENGVLDDGDIMEVAETHLFRPLFRYRAQMEKKRLRRINDEDNNDEFIDGNAN